MNKTGTAYRVFQFITTFLLTALIAFTIMVAITISRVNHNVSVFFNKPDTRSSDKILYLPQQTKNDQPNDQPNYQPSTIYYPNYLKSPYIDHLWHWDHFPVKVYFKYENSADKQAAWYVLAGFDEWVNATNRAVTYQVTDQSAEAEITIQFTHDNFIPGKPGTAGETAVNSIHNVVKSAVMTLAIGDVTNEDLQSVAAHEFGHALGIGGHSNIKEDLMYPVETRYITENNLPLHKPPHPVTTNDLNTLRTAYPLSFNNQIGL